MKCSLHVENGEYSFIIIILSLLRWCDKRSSTHWHEVSQVPPVVIVFQGLQQQLCSVTITKICALCLWQEEARGTFH